MNVERMATPLLALALFVGVGGTLLPAAVVHPRTGTPYTAQIVGLTGDQLRLRDEAGEAREIRRSEVTGLLFAADEPDDFGRPDVRAEFPGGEVLTGEFLSLDRKRLRLATAFAAEVDVPRSALKSLRWTGTRSDVVYEGPYSTNEWLISPIASGADAGRPSWVLRDGVYLSRGKGTLSVDCGVPTIARVEFDMYWQNAPRIRIAAYVRDLVNYVDSEGYHFYSSGKGAIYALSRGRQPGRAVRVPRGIVPALTNSSQVHLDFRLNSHTGEGWLFADGKEIKRWTDLGYSGAGMGVMFYVYRPETRIGIANLRVTDWDGRTTMIPEAPSARSVVLFRNGDHVDSTALDSDGQRLRFSYDGRPITVPLERVSEIHQLKAARPAGHDRADTWIRFAQGNWLRVRLTAWRDGRLEWESPLIGRGRSPVAAVRGVHFSKDKPVLDLSWYLTKTPGAASE